MTILDLVKGLEVMIVMNGQPLPEYEDGDVAVAVNGSKAAQYRASRTVTKYIESQEGQYEVHIKLDSTFNFNFPTLWSAIKIDGGGPHDVVRSKTRHDNCGGSTLWVTKGTAFRIPGLATSDLIKPFAFSKIELASDDSQGNDRKDLDGVGLITVELFRASAGKKMVNTKVRLDATNTGALTVDEKAFKGCAKSHCTSYGAAVPHKTQFKNCKKLDDEGKPLAVFSFKYRDRKALQSLLIIPRSPSPEEEAEASDDDSLNLANLDPQEVKKLKKLYRSLKSNENAPSWPATIKRERDDDSNGGNLRKKRKSNETPEVIDLTGSDA